MFAKDSQPEGGPDAAKRIPLSTELRTAAENVAKASSAMDRGEIEAADIDFVNLHFDGLAGLEKADELLHGLAMHDLSHRTNFSNRWARYLSGYLIPLRDHIKEQLATLKATGTTGQKATTLFTGSLGRANDAIKVFEEALKQFDGLPDEAQPHETIPLWRKLNDSMAAWAQIRQEAFQAALESKNKGLGTIFFSASPSTGSTSTRANNAPLGLKTKEHPGVAPSIKPPPMHQTSPVRIDEQTDTWFSLPFSDFFAIETLRFCHTVQNSNIPLSGILVPSRCSRELDVYAQVFRDCGLHRVEIPSHESIDPTTEARLDSQMDDLIHHLAQIFKILRAKESSHTSTKSSAIVQHPSECADSITKPLSDPSRNHHKVVVTEECAVTLDRRIVSDGKAKKVLLALALLAPSEQKGTFSLEKNAVVKLVYGKLPNAGGRIERDNTSRALKRVCKELGCNYFESRIGPGRDNRTYDGLVFVLECKPNAIEAKLRE